MDAHPTASPARHSLAVVEDCCQAHLATCGRIPVGTRGVGGAFSFYPTKNLGALGDGGAVVTNDATRSPIAFARLRNGGQASRYHHVEAGVNSRLDELQAAVLRARLPRLRAVDGAAPRAGARSIAQLAAGVTAPIARARRRARLPSVSGALARTRGAAGAPGAARHRDADSLPGAAAPSSRRSRRLAPARRARSPSRAARELLSLPLHPRLHRRRRRRASPTRCDAFRKGRVPRESADHRRRRVHRLAPRRAAARATATR